MIRIIEGFDFVGKSAVIANYCKGYTYYHPDYSEFDKFFNRDIAFLYGYGQFDFLNQIRLQLPNIVIDRALPSSWVYSRLYNNQETLPSEIANHYFKLIDECCMTVEFVHVSHIDKDSAKRIYENDTNHNDILDQFNNFEEYWNYYEKAERLFLDFYKAYNIHPTMFVTNSNETGTHVEVIKV